MSNQPPLNPDALEAVTRERYESGRSFEDLPPWEDLVERNRKAELRAIGNIVSAYLAAAQLVVNSVEELITTRAGLALANAAFNEGLSAGIRACNESLEGEPFVKPVSPYRSEVDE